MDKKLKAISIASTAACLMGVLSPTAVMAADNNSQVLNDETTVENKNNDLQQNSDQNFQLADKYVKVENNKFVLSNEGKNVLPSIMNKQIETRLSKVNQAVKDDNLVIDPDTKEIVKYSPYTMFAAGVKGAARLRSGCYVRAFWWGVRIYFTSNAAVSWFRGKLSAGSTIADISAMIAHATGHEIAGTLVDAFSLAATSMSNRLYNYNKAHKHSKVYIDLNYTSTYSFHTF